MINIQCYPRLKFLNEFDFKLQMEVSMSKIFPICWYNVFVHVIDEMLPPWDQWRMGDNQ